MFLIERRTEMVRIYYRLGVGCVCVCVCLGGGGRPAKSHCLTVRLTVWGINSRSHGLASKSHGESKHPEIAK